MVLGNPPWERIKLQEKEWFASRDEAIATARNAAARRKLIAQLPQTNPALHEAFMADKRKAEGESHFVRNSGQYPLCGRGDVNTYTIFAELARHVQRETGRVGIIVPSGIATDDTTKYYFQEIMEGAALVSLYDFENRKKIFPAVDSRMKFSLMTLTGEEKPATAGAQFVFFALEVADLRDEERRFTLSAADIALLNPNTRTCPIFRSKRDAELTKAIYRRVPVLIKEESPEVNPWGVKFFTMFHMSNDSGLFRTREQLEGEGWRLEGNRFVRRVMREDVKREAVYLPLYEAKMLHHFDHRWATYDGLETRDFTAAEKDDPARLVLSRYWVREAEVNGRLANNQNWFIGFRDITNTTNERTAIFSILGKTAVGHTAPLIFLQTLGASYGGFLFAVLDSLVFDYSTRQKVGGTHMTYTYLKQLPVLPPQTYHQPCPWLSPAPLPPCSLASFLLPRVLELTYTAYDLRPFAQECGYHGPPFRWQEERRFLLRCELDAAYFHLYGIGREDTAYIMDTFPIVRRKDEAAHGEYRTKRVILEMYDEMAASMQGARGQGARGQGAGGQGAGGKGQVAGGKPYQTRLDPPPAHPDAAHPWDEAYLGPALPRDEWWEKRDADSRPGRAQIGAERAQMDADKDRRESAPRQRHQRSIRPIREPAPKLELKRPAAAKKPGFSKKPGFLEAQPALVTDFTPPAGGYGQRLKRVMALGQPKNQADLAELIAALGDDSDQIRWLAGASLARLGGPVVVKLLAAYLATDPGGNGRAEVIKVLGLIAETAEDTAVQAAARQAAEA